MRFIYILFGCVSLVVGIIGIVVPLLPTVPFVLLAAFFFGKGSPRLHAWLLSQKYLGPVIRDWNEHRRISRKAKTYAICCTIFSIGISIVVVKLLLLKLLLFIIAVVVIAFIATRKS